MATLHERASICLQQIIIPSLAVLPPKMSTPRAWAMLAAIGLQESELRYREQRSGPAQGLWQFETAGVSGVLRHSATGYMAVDVCHAHDVASTVDAVYQNLSRDDGLACCFARLLLWTLPDALPAEHEQDNGWAQYLSAWRPGRPHPEKWPKNWTAAWAAVRGL